MRRPFRWGSAFRRQKRRRGDHHQCDGDSETMGKSRYRLLLDGGRPHVGAGDSTVLKWEAAGVGNPADLAVVGLTP